MHKVRRGKGRQKYALVCCLENLIWFFPETVNEGTLVYVRYEKFNIFIFYFLYSTPRFCIYNILINVMLSGWFLFLLTYMRLHAAYVYVRCRTCILLRHLNKSEFPFAMSAAAPELRICTLDKQLLPNNEFSTCLMVGILMFFEIVWAHTPAHNIMYLPICCLFFLFHSWLLFTVLLKATLENGCIHFSFPPSIIASLAKSFETERETSNNLEICSLSQ